MARHQQNAALLEAALIGYEAELARIMAAMADIQKRLGKCGVREGIGLLLILPRVRSTGFQPRAAGESPKPNADVGWRLRRELRA
jgi:hypothetical protein